MAEENEKQSKSLLQQAAASSPQDKAPEGEQKYVVNPALKAAKVTLSGKDLGGDGENKNEFHVNREYSNVSNAALEQKFNGTSFLVKLN